jgi:hypothetical protein
VDQPRVIQLDRRRRVARAMNARRRLRAAPGRHNRDRPTGRAWLNGRELGDTRVALSHLAESYD